MKYVLLFDFGSTFTKAAVVSRKDKQIVFSSKVPSTVRTDASSGLNQLLDAIRQAIGPEETRLAARYASSSAAGGLRMAVLGISKSLSAAAAKTASLGAGARLVHTSAGHLSDEEMSELERSQAEILLFCGGYEGGSYGPLLSNARRLAQSTLRCPILFGGNSAAASEVRQILAEGGKECQLIPNVIPDVGQLHTGPAEEAIRRLFMKNIVSMKGLDRVQRQTGPILMPTPAAVLQAGDLLSRGSENGSGLGNLLIADLGGATTDIHSYAAHTAFEGSRLTGAAEPYAKRTVEGDLGMRESAGSLTAAADCQAMARQAGVSEAFLSQAVIRRMENPAFLPQTKEERAVDQEIARQAIGLAARRHAGRIEHTLSSNCRYIQKGKNLTEVCTVLGTGGQIINSPDPAETLRGILVRRDAEPDVLLPEASSFYIDSQYMLYAAGLLCQTDPELALAVMRHSMKQW